MKSAICSIHSRLLIPDFLSNVEISNSDIWGKEITFVKDEYHLISAVSGAGKSSLLSYLFGERSDYAGEIIFNDRIIDSFKSAEWSDIRQNRISFVFQGLRLFPELTAFENICLKNQLTSHKSDDEILFMLETAGLAGKCNEKAVRLSFGQQQRIAIIRALCQPFDFLFLDEPFSHLDDDNIGIMANMITKEVKSKQAGLLLCSLGVEYPFGYHKKWKL